MLMVYDMSLGLFHPQSVTFNSSEDVKQTCMLAEWSYIIHVGLDCTSRTRDT